MVRKFWRRKGYSWVSRVGDRGSGLPFAQWGFTVSPKRSAEPHQGECVTMPYLPSTYLCMDAHTGISPSRIKIGRCGQSLSSRSLAQPTVLPFEMRGISAVGWFCVATDQTQESHIFCTTSLGLWEVQQKGLDSFDVGLIGLQVFHGTCDLARKEIVRKEGWQLPSYTWGRSWRKPNLR